MKQMRFIYLLLLTAAFSTFARISSAQPSLPQRSVTITATQGIHFGTFCLTGSSGGTVSVGWDGSRSSTGDIYPLSMAPTSHPAVFEIKLCEGRNVTISFDAVTPLSGSNGGTLMMNLGPTEKGPNGCTFTVNSDCNFVTPLRMGGTLHIPGTAIPGTYTGSFSITFNQQ